VSYVASVFTLRLIRVELNAERSSAPPTRLREDIRTGMLWLWRQPLLRFLALLVGGGLLVEAGYILIVIVLAQRMGASSEVIGLILGVGGAGSVGGALLAAPWPGISPSGRSRSASTGSGPLPCRSIPSRAARSRSALSPPWPLAVPPSFLSPS